MRKKIYIKFLFSSSASSHSYGQEKKEEEKENTLTRNGCSFWSSAITISRLGFLIDDITSKEEPKLVIVA